MAQTLDELAKKLPLLAQKSLEAAGQQLIAEADKWVPIDRGRLRRTARVDTNRNGTVSVKYGGRVLRYARKQYFGSLRHLMDGGEPTRLLRYGRGLATGQTHKSRYRAAYRKALKDGVLRRVPGGLQWLHRALKDSRSRKRVDAVFRNFFK